MSDTQTSTLGLTMPTGTQVYDSLMAKIEPDLVTANIAHLDEPYATETKAQRASRYQRYTKAYSAYDKAFEAWMNEFTAGIHTFRRTAMQAMESQSRAEETDAVTSLDAEIASSTD